MPHISQKLCPAMADLPKLHSSLESTWQSCSVAPQSCPIQCLTSSCACAMLLAGSFGNRQQALARLTLQATTD